MAPATGPGHLRPVCPDRMAEPERAPVPRLPELGWLFPAVPPADTKGETPTPPRGVQRGAASSEASFRCCRWCSKDDLRSFRRPRPESACPLGMHRAQFPCFGNDTGI